MKINVDINVGGNPRHIVEVMNDIDTKNQFLSIRKRGSEKTHIVMPIEVDGCDPQTHYAFISDDDNYIYACTKNKLGGTIIELNWLYEDEYRVINKENITLIIRENK